MAKTATPQPNSAPVPMQTIEGLAEEWQVSSRTVWHEIRRGRLRACKIATVWRIRREDIEAYLAERAS